MTSWNAHQRRLIIQGSKTVDPERHPDSRKFFREPKKPVASRVFQLIWWVAVLGFIIFLTTK